MWAVGTPWPNNWLAASHGCIAAAADCAAAWPAAERRAAHPPVTMKTSMKKEPMAEEMVSVLHTQATAWNREVALRAVMRLRGALVSWCGVCTEGWHEGGYVGARQGSKRARPK